MTANGKTNQFCVRAMFVHTISIRQFVCWKRRTICVIIGSDSSRLPAVAEYFYLQQITCSRPKKKYSLSHRQFDFAPEGVFYGLDEFEPSLLMIFSDFVLPINIQSMFVCRSAVHANG